MKNRYIFFYMLLVLFTTTSCEGFLNITPEGQSKRDQLLSTPQGIEDAMYGVYSQMRSKSLYGQELELNSPIPVRLSSLIPRMSTFTLVIACLTTSNLP